MSYEEEDTCHMRRRIHACVYLPSSRLLAVSGQCVVSRMCSLWHWGALVGRDKWDVTSGT